MDKRWIRRALTGAAALSAATVCAAWALGAPGWAVFDASDETGGDDPWRDVSVPGDLDPPELRRAVTTVERVVVQDEPLRPRFALALGVDVPLDSTCSNNSIAYVAAAGDPAGDEDYVWQILDTAKLALLTGRPVAVVVNLSDTSRAASGCVRPRVVRLALSGG